MFECDCCGECCKHLDSSQLYAELDDGNGVCIYLSGNLCTIYDERPLICRIDESYELFFADLMEKETFYNLNKKVCREFKRERGK